VTDFGAFVDLQLPDGRFSIYPFHLHISVLWIVLCPTPPCLLLLLILRKRKGANLGPLPTNNAHRFLSLELCTQTNWIHVIRLEEFLLWTSKLL
jgi:hypothetical protein